LNDNGNPLGKAVTDSGAIVFSRDKANDGLIKFQVLKDKTRMLLLSGEPLDQPIVQYGPFVLNTPEEIQQAFDDYRQSKNGFEGASRWESKIRHLKNRSKSAEILKRYRKK